MANSELVRVRLDNGAEATVGASFARSFGLEELDKPATKHGRAISDKPRTSVAEATGRNETPNPSGSDSPASSKEEKK